MLINKNETNVILPIIEQAETHDDREIILIFLHYFRDDGSSSADIRVFRAINKAAVLTGYSDAVIARILVTCGLRSSRRSLPQEFLNHVDMTAYRVRPSKIYKALKEFWSESCGENLNIFNPAIYQAGMVAYATD
jgi:hypothetical protein